jgi:glucose/mannose transport system permease protein
MSDSNATDATAAAVGIADTLEDRLTTLRRSDFVRSLPFLFVPAVLIGVFVYGSIIWNLLLSLTEFEGFGDPDYSDLGFSMYAQMLSDSQFITATQNTVVLIIGFTVLCLLVGMALAILVDRDVKFEGTIRTIYLLPMSISFVVTSIFWAWMFNPTSGVINVFLRAVGLGVFAV